VKTKRPEVLPRASAPKASGILSHDMDPHIDIVLLHDFRQDHIKLFPTNLIIHFF
jgi:hypothetical protein